MNSEPLKIGIAKETKGNALRVISPPSVRAPVGRISGGTVHAARRFAAHGAEYVCFLAAEIHLGAVNTHLS